MGFNVVTVNTAANIVLSANTQRLSVLLVNEGTTTIYLGEDSTLTTGTGLPLRQNENLTEDSGGQKVYLGNIYGVVATGTGTARYWERIRK